ncbi:MAG: Maf family nucleotide pyrophosphatase [Planctomycetota bacterium]
MQPARVRSLGPLLLAAAACLLAPGCDQPRRHAQPYAARAGERIYVTFQNERVGAEEDAFALASSIDSLRKHWTAPERYRGRIAGLVGGTDGIRAVFASGLVQAIRHEDGRHQQEELVRGRQALVAAAATEEVIYGLQHAHGALQMHRLDPGADAWRPTGPPLTPPGEVADVQVALLAEQPCVLWRVPLSTGRQALRAAVLTPSGWEALPLPPAAVGRIPLAATGGEAGVVVLATAPDGDGIPDPFNGTLRLALSRYAEGGWNRFGTATLDGLSLTAGGWSAALCPDDDGWLAVIADGESVRRIRFDPDGTASAAVRLAGLPPSAAVGGWLWVATTTMLFLGLAVFHAVLLRRRFRQPAPGSAPPPTAPQPASGQPEAGRSPAEEAAAVHGAAVGVGGVATPMERALAFLVDTILILPAFLVFLVVEGAGWDALQEDLVSLDRFLPGMVCFQIVFVLYATLAETVTGQTVGKRLLGLCVRRQEGGRPEGWRILARNVLRPVDSVALPIGGFPIPFFPALVSMLFSRTNQRVGDRMGGTMVVRRVGLERRRIILASGSPRRRAWLQRLGLPFGVLAPDVDEHLPPRSTPSEAAVGLAQRKAEAVGRRLQDGEIVIAADTLVAHDGEILGKPRDRAHAREMLQRLAGDVHDVVTGVAIWDRASGRRLAAFARTEVQMAPLSDEEIERYLATGEADDKAGAYGIQGEAGRFCHVLGGSHSNVVGLPLELLHPMLEELEA